MSAQPAERGKHRVHWYGNPYYPGCHVAVFTRSTARRIFRPAAVTNEPEQITCLVCKAGFSANGREAQ